MNGKRAKKLRREAREQARSAGAKERELTGRVHRLRADHIATQFIAMPGTARAIYLQKKAGGET